MAAKKVNTKFVLALAGGLLSVTAMAAGAGYYFLRNTDTKLAALGDEASARKDWKAADRFYAKAVNKAQANPDYLRKWIGAMENYVPASQTEFQARFSNDYVRAKGKLAILLRTDIAAHREYLELMHRNALEQGSDRTDTEAIAGRVAEALSYFESNTDPARPWDVLRRYRGMAYLRNQQSVGSLAQEEVDKAKEDLEAACKADPNDGEAASALNKWYSVQARVLRDRGRTDEAAAMIKKGREGFATFAAAHPEHPAVYFNTIDAMIEDAQNETRSMPEDKASVRFDKLATDVRGVMDRLFDSLSKTAPDKIQFDDLERFYVVEQSLGGKEPLALTRKLLEKYIAAFPDRVDAMQVMAALLHFQRDDAGAIAQLQKIVDLPDRPVSPQGAKLFGSRIVARSRQIQYTLQMAEQLPEAEKAAAIAKTEGYRAELLKLTGEGAPSINYADGQIAFAKAQYSQAYKLLLDFNKAIAEQDPEALWLLAESAYRSREPDVAKTKLQALIKRQPGNIRAVVRLADIEQTLGNLAEAKRLYTTAAKALPDDDYVKKGLQSTRERLGEIESSDPSIRALQEARALEEKGDVKGATALLERVWKESHPQRICGVVATRRNGAGDKEGAIKMVEEGLALYPDSVDLKQLKIALTITDRTQAQIAQIDADSSLDPQARALAKYRVYQAGGKKEEADKALDDLAKLAPEDPLVLELRFNEALGRKDFAAAEKIFATARDRNFDKIDGVTFRARILQAQGDSRQAIRELEAARTKPTFSVEAARYLGELYIQDNRVDDAIGALKLGLSKRSNDVGTILTLARLLTAADRGSEAVELCRAKRESVSNNFEFVDLWLALEARYGDQETALRYRKQQVDLNPNERTTKASLASLYIDMKRWNEAKPLIDDLRKQADDLSAVVMEARWNADQNKLAEARAVFENYIKSIPDDKRTIEPYLAFAQFMSQQLQDEAAETALKQAQKYEDKKSLPATRALAELYGRQDRVVESADACKAVIAADADPKPERPYTKRLIDAMLRTQQVDEAAKILDKLGTEVEKDPVLLLQKGEIAMARNNDKEAGKAIDAAVARFPNDPLAYYRRALFYGRQKDQQDKVLDDLNRAIELRPSFFQALRARAMHFLLESPPQKERAFADLKQAAELNPNVDELRVSIVRDLLQAKKDGEAAALIEGIANKRRGDVALLVNSGDLFREAGLESRALEFYKRAYQLSPQLFVVTRYLELLQRGDQPDLKEAERVLKEMGDQVGKDPALLMARARQQFRKSRSDDALRDILASLRLIDPNKSPELVLAWFGDLTRVVKNRNELPTVLEAVDREKLAIGWTDFFRIGLLLEKETPADVEKGLQMAERMKADGKDKILQRQVYMVLQSKYASMKRNADAERVMKEAVVDFPNDWYFLNNYAYTLSVNHPERAAESVKLAEVAVDEAKRVNRESADVQDTLGTVYTLAGKLDQAEAPLIRALALAGNTPIRNTVLLHLAQLRLAQKRLDDAKRIVRDVEGPITERPQPGQQEDLAALKKSLDM